MITRVGFKLANNYSISNNNSKYQSQPIMSKMQASLGDCFVSFGSKETEDADNEISKLKKIMYSADAPAKGMIKDLASEAKESGYSKITTLHVIKHGLKEVDKYIDTLNSGKKEPKVKPSTVELLSGLVNPEMFSKKQYRENTQKIVKNQIEQIDELLKEHKSEFENKSEKITFSDDMVDSIWSLKQETQSDVVTPWLLMQSSLSAEDEVTMQTVEDLVFNLSEVVMRNRSNSSDRAPFSELNQKAERVLKNITLGTNVFLTYDPMKESPKMFLDTINEVNKKKYGDKFEFIELNHKAKPDYLGAVIENARENPDDEYIIAACPSSIITQFATVAKNDSNLSAVPLELMNALYNKPENVKFIFYDASANYSSYTSAEPLKSLFADYEEASTPALNSTQMVKYYKENPSIFKDVKKTFSKNAVERAIIVSNNIDGVFPDKTKDLMNKIANYYAEKKEINERDVENYLSEASNLLKKEASDSSVYVVFDTGKRLKDLVGKESTKKEASLIVKQIKSGNMGTKGVIIYSQDGYPGGGRRFTAKAIAGEAHIPYLEINAVDFGTKDVDLFGGGELSPEAAVKQLFATVKTQAEANPNKAAMLFIENFEFFSVGEKVSMYHEKAMAQLLREMDKAREQGLNILVAGSVSDPRLIGKATMKSFKFVDTIEVASPAFSKESRADVIEKTLKASKVRLAGSVEERKAIVAYVSDISDRFSYIELKRLLRKAVSVAEERGHKILNKGDFTEAYLQMITGRPSMEKMPEHVKDIVASHECGHATNLEVMNNIAKTLGKPWHVPSKVNFITLDPRGVYGGAVFHGEDTNTEVSFENIFGDMVCSFGGNSAESLFFGIDGSYGISSDMESVRNRAEVMVKVMGLGTKTGKMSIGDDDVLSDAMLKRIEDDERVIMNNAKITSDLITEMYSDFNKWFTQKYSPLVGTGDCIMDGDTFRKALKQWRAEQPLEKQRMLQACDETIVEIMEATKRGIAVRKKD